MVLAILIISFIVSIISILASRIRIIISNICILVCVISIRIHGSAPPKKKEILGMPTMY